MTWTFPSSDKGDNAETKAAVKTYTNTGQAKGTTRRLQRQICQNSLREVTDITLQYSYYISILPS